MKNAKIFLGIGVVLILLWFLFGRKKSCADPVADPASMGSGDILSKTPQESCQVKYGQDWSQLSSTMCKKN